jgi:phosphoribosyl-ATP pyrophosphohydrolase
MSSTLLALSATIASRKGASPETSYVAKLHSKGLDAMLKKVGEEATETVMAAKDGDGAHVVREVADLWFHSLVVLSHFGLSAADVIAELERREGVSGVAEKAARIDSQASPPSNA